MLIVLTKVNYLILLGTTSKRRNEEIARLNKMYVDLVPEKQTIQKCFKHLCQSNAYRVLRDWCYGNESDPLQTSSHPEFTDVRIVI